MAAGEAEQNRRLLQRSSEAEDECRVFKWACCVVVAAVAAAAVANKTAEIRQPAHRSLSACVPLPLFLLLCSLSSACACDELCEAGRSLVLHVRLSHQSRPTRSLHTGSNEASMFPKQSSE